jgi:hypothetical protein
MGLGFGADVDHVGLTALIKMSQATIIGFHIG